MTIGILMRLELDSEKKTGEIRDLLVRFHKQSQEEPGLEYSHIIEDLDTQFVFFILEKWSSQQYFENHIASAHFQGLGQALKDKGANMRIRRVKPVS